MTDKLPDGIHLHLPEEQYFADRSRLGGSDICKLVTRGEGFWWSSWMNPKKVEVETKGKTVGKALHAALGEGLAAYESRFAVLPERSDFPDLLVTVEDIRTALTDEGFDPPAKWSKTTLIEFAKTRAPGLTIWDVVLERFEAQSEGREAVTGVEDQQIRVMADMVHSHPELGQLLRPGPNNVVLSEVSIIYHDQHGIPRRARLDLMLPTVTIDWKTLENVGARPLKFAVGDQLAKYAYFAQMADYHMARRHAYRFIQEGRIFGASPEEAAWLKRFPAEAPSWAWAFGFIQKPNAKDGQAPVFFPWEEEWGSELHRRGIRAQRQAIETYRRCMKEFGPDKPWTRVEPIHTSDEAERINRVFLPHWISFDEYVPGEDEDL